MATIYGKIATGNDDAFEASDGGVNLTAVNAVFTGADQYWSGRFSLAVAQGATINKAFLSVYMQTSPATPVGSVYASDEDNAAQLSGTDYEISNKTSTTATASFTWTNGLGGDWRFIDVTDIVQEIVDRGSWASGNYIMLIIAAGAGIDFKIRQYDGTAADAAELHVTHGETEPDLRVQINASGNDGQEDSGGGVNLTGPQLRLINGTPHNYLRFTNVTIPQYATIDSAYLKIVLHNTTYDTVDINIHGHLIGNSAISDGSDNDLSQDRAKTLAYVNWDAANIIASGQTAFYSSPDIKTVIQEIVNHQDWASGNALSLLMRHIAGAIKEFWYRTFDCAPAMGAMLEINYTEASGQPSSIPVWLAVSQSSDDSEARTGQAPGLTNASLNMSDGNTDRKVGFRFQNVPIPQGVTVDNAYLYVCFNDGSFDDPDCDLHAEDIDDSPTFTTTVDDIEDRTLTTENVLWDATGLHLGIYEDYRLIQSPSLTAVIQEVINRTGWAEGNDLSVIAVSNGNTSGYVQAWDAEGIEQSAKLYVAYQPPITGRPLRQGLEAGLRQGLSI